MTDHITTIKNFVSRDPNAVGYHGGPAPFERKLEGASEASLQAFAADLMSSERRGSVKQADLITTLMQQDGSLNAHGGYRAVLAYTQLLPSSWANARIRELKAKLGWDSPAAPSTPDQHRYHEYLQKRAGERLTPFSRLEDMTFLEVKGLIRRLRVQLGEVRPNAGEALAKAEEQAAVSAIAADLGNVTDIFSKRSA